MLLLLIMIDEYLRGGQLDAADYVVKSNCYRSTVGIPALNWHLVRSSVPELRAWIVYRQKDGQTDRRSGTHNVACS